MKKKELLNAKKALIGLTLAALAGSCAIKEYQGNEKDIYVYEKDENGNYVNPKEFHYHKYLDNNDFFDEYNGMDLKIVDDDYIILKEMDKGKLTKSRIYFKEEDQYSNPTIMNSYEDGYYYVINYANSESKRRSR